MPTLDTRVLDAALNQIIGDATDMALCSTDPGSGPAAWADFENAELASKAAPQFSTIEDNGTGRRVGIQPFTDGVWSVDGTATTWCLVDRTSEIVLCTRALSVPKAGVAGQSFTVADVFYITFPGPT